MSLDVLKTKIKENKLSGVFLFYGAEEYTKDHFAEQIRSKVDSSPLPEFNHIFFNASSDKISELEDAVYSLPYMWDTKLIEITDIESAKLTESDINDYSRIFSDIPEYLTVLAVLRYNESEEDKSKANKSASQAFVKLFNEHGLAVEFETEKADRLTTWITRHLNAKGVKYDVSVPREIVNVCGNDMYILQSEILKLSEIYNGNPLSVYDVRKYCCANVAYKYYDMVSALNKRDIVLANKILASLDLNRESLPKAIGLIAKNYSEMLLVRLGIDSGKSLDLIAKETKIPIWLCRKIASSVGGIDISLLSFAINQISLADKKIKSFRGDPNRILEFAFYRICTYGRKA